ncbi:MAG: hypothetical protein RBU30_10555, partial [Polyangia bacterium]|nr:hypothetical protein [Polyangia bacterium]
MRQTLVFSDLHLSPREEGDGAWMRFRQRSFFADDAFSSLVEQLLGRLGNAPLEVVFNGDTFELDGAAAWSSGPRAPDEDQGSEGSEAANLERILDDHPAIVRAMGRLLERAERLVFVSGNHDQGLYFPEVQRRLRARLVAAAEAQPGAHPGSDLSERVIFRPWFHRTADGL